MGKVKLSAIILLTVILLSGCQSPKTVTQPAPVPPVTQPVPLPPATTPLPPAPTIPIGVSIGNLAPDFQLRTLTGDNISLSSLRGKPVLINFWATWCGPCKAEMPYLQQINDTWSAKGLVLLAVDIGEKPATIEKFMNELNLSMTVPMDSDGKVAKAYLIGAIPTTFLIDKDGVIRQKIVGAFPSAEAIEKELSKIMP